MSCFPIKRMNEDFFEEYVPVVSWFFQASVDVDSMIHWTYSSLEFASRLWTHTVDGQNHPSGIEVCHNHLKQP